MEHFNICTEVDGKAISICTCGNKWEDGSNKCNQCNSNFESKFISNNFNGGFVSSGYYYELVENGDWGFIVQKIKIYAKYSRKDLSLEKSEMVSHTLYYDFRVKTFKIDQEESLSFDKLKEFLTEIDKDNFIKLVCTEKFKNLLKFAITTYGNFSSSGYTDKTKLCSGLLNIHRYGEFQILANLGFTSSMLSQFINASTSFRQNFIKRDATKPHEMLGVPKYILPLLLKLESSSCTGLIGFRKLDKELGLDNTQFIIEKLIDETDKDNAQYFLETSCKSFVEIIKEYRYEPKQFINYLCRDVKLQQGITSPKDALELVSDYMKMMKSMELHSDKYSKSLKKDHDIAQLNYKTVENELTKKEFVSVVSSDKYKGLEFKGNKYTIISPTEPKDLISEGESLSHCIASYIKDVINKKCSIYFLRLKTEKQKSLVTIEVRGEKIIQAKGHSNRKINDNERRVINSWAEKKNLLIAV